MNLTGLIGYPVSHSLSPAIHEYWLREHNIEAEYKLFTTAPARLRQVVHRLRNKNALGFNVTIPHKQTVIEYLDSLDKNARDIGAVNTVIRVGDLYIGTNTDAYGFITHLKESAPKLDLTRVVILGAGGATRAAIVALKEAGANEILLTNRTEQTARELAEEFGIGAAPWETSEFALEGATLLVNTTSLGMEGQAALELSLEALPKTATVYDIVYAPLDTELLKAARARGNTTVDGLGMLLHQAAAAFRMWHKVDVNVTPQLRAHVLGRAP